LCVKLLKHGTTFFLSLEGEIAKVDALCFTPPSSFCYQCRDYSKYFNEYPVGGERDIRRSSESFKLSFRLNVETVRQSFPIFLQSVVADNHNELQSISLFHRCLLGIRGVSDFLRISICFYSPCWPNAAQLARFRFTRSYADALRAIFVGYKTEFLSDSVRVLISRRSCALDRLITKVYQLPISFKISPIILLWHPSKMIKLRVK